MSKAFSVASWNVEHFGAISKKTKKPEKPVEPIIEYIGSQQADVFAIYEVRSEYVFGPLSKMMPDYQFYITEGPQIQEILIGIRSGLSAFVTQKIEFKSGQSTLRPGVLVTVQVEGKYYPMLFLHLKSMPDPKGFGLRDDMLHRAIKFRSNLDEAAGGAGKANYLFLGDMNTMGFDYYRKDHDITGNDEIKELERRARYKKMRRLRKSVEVTWWNGNNDYRPGSSLDHVIAADHLQFMEMDGAEISVRGWPDEQTDVKKQDWIKTYSDHALLYFEIQKV